MFRRSPFQPYLRLTSRFLNSNHPLQAPLMSSKSPSPSPQEEPHPHPHPHPHSEKALPAPGKDGDRNNTCNKDGVTTLDISGGAATVRLDALGPMVVNQDGTISRISNWSKMSDIERTNTLRIIGKRNQTRLAALRKAQESNATDTGSSEKDGRDGQSGQSGQ